MKLGTMVGNGMAMSWVRRAPRKLAQMIKVVATFQTRFNASQCKRKEVMRNPLQREKIFIDNKISLSITVNAVGGLF